jgi:hypothetical protein
MAALRSQAPLHRKPHVLARHASVATRLQQQLLHLAAGQAARRRVACFETGLTRGRQEGL